MGFATDGSFNSDPGDELKIVKKDHPITEELKEKVKIHKPLAQLMTCNGFQGDADIIAIRADNEKLVAISVYEGGQINKRGHQTRHVNIWSHSTGWEMITDEGWKLIEHSVLYALGRIPQAVIQKML